MNNIINNLFLLGNKFLPEMQLIQLQYRFTYSSCGPFAKNKETNDLRYIYQNNFNKACFQHSMCYGYYNVLAGRTDSDIELHVSI